MNNHQAALQFGVQYSDVYHEKINKEKAKNQLTFQNEFIIINERHRDVSTISDELLIQEKYSSG